jgi:phosphoesterase RecJ-like protein
LNLISKAQKITLLTHLRPDGDGMSACAALDCIFAKMGKIVETIYPDQPETNIKRQAKNIQINTHSFIPDIIIACDTANYQRTYYPKEFLDIKLINIDHHVSNSLKTKYNFVNPSASSTCEELFFLLLYWAPDYIDSYCANCLLYGILYDSQVFYTESTTARTLFASASLINYEANLFKLKQEFLVDKNPEIIKLWGRLLNNISIIQQKKAALASISQKDLKDLNLNISALVGFSNFLWQICNVDITILFYETESGDTKISLRSKISDVDAFANKFGGGGHTHAAGIIIKKPLDQAIKEITQAL